jgi:transcriptional regulator with XRE-family HTH domain
MSQEELSLQTGVHLNFIGGIERAERSPSVVTIIRLAYRSRLRAGGATDPFRWLAD